MDDNVPLLYRFCLTFPTIACVKNQQSRNPDISIATMLTIVSSWSAFSLSLNLMHRGNPEQSAALFEPWLTQWSVCAWCSLECLSGCLHILPHSHSPDNQPTSAPLTVIICTTLQYWTIHTVLVIHLHIVVKNKTFKQFSSPLSRLSLN